MRSLLIGCALLSGASLVLTDSPASRVNAQAKSAAPAKSASQTSANIDPQKEARIRELMEITGAKDLGQQLIEAGMEQFRNTVMDSQPDNPRAKQFVAAFTARFQKRFDTTSLNELIVPIYDKYLTSDDLQGLLDYYHSPLGQRMLKLLPEVTRESQAAGYALGQKAAQETMDELKSDFPEFAGSPQEDKSPGPNQQPN